jgi:hypothetical protein
MSAQEDRFNKETVGHGDDDDEEKTAVKYLYEKPEGRDGMTDSNPKSKYNEANVVRKKGNVRQEQRDQFLKVPGYKIIGDEQDPHDDDEDHDVSNVEKLSRQSGRSFMAEPVTKSLGDTAYETILDKDPGKNKVHEKPENNHKVKYDKNNAVKTQMYEKPELKDGMLKNNSKPVIKSLGEAAFEKPLDKDCGKYRAHEKPGTRVVIADITDTVMSDMVHKASIEDYQDRKLNMDEKPEPRDGMLKFNPKEIQMFKEPEMRMLKTTLKGTYDRNVNMDHVMDKKPEMNVNVKYEAGIEVHQAGEINMFEETEMKILKTNPMYKNLNVRAR